MGRELKRVAPDFQWPEDKVWDGYINPHYSRQHECPACKGSGSSPSARRLAAQWYGNAPFRPESRGSTPFLPTHPAVRCKALMNVERSPGYYGAGEDAVQREAERLASIFNAGWCHHLNADDVAALVARDRLKDFTHNWSRPTGWVRKDPPYIPDPEEVNVWSLSGLSHDASNRHIVIRAECERLGIDPACSNCGGEGAVWDSPEAKNDYETWECVEPPAGDGYQIWETVREGRPISPVFATPEELARHMAGKRWGGDPGSSYETWLAFIQGPGWAPSMVVDQDGVRTGADAAFFVGSDER